MKCARCSAEVPSHSQFCLRCGTPIHRPGGPTSGRVATTPITTPRDNNRTALIMIVLLILLAGALGFLVVKGQLTQKAGPSDSGRLVQKPGRGKRAPMVQVPGEPNNADVEDYLAFLKGIEAKKQKLAKDELASALYTYGNLTKKQADAVNDDKNNGQDFLPGVKNDMKDFPDQWNSLAALFNQKTPPASCQDLHDNYYDHLGKIQGEFQAVQNAIDKASTDPAGAIRDLTNLQGTASAEADQSAKSADDALDAVCQKYHLHKDFDIKTDASGFQGLLH